VLPLAGGLREVEEEEPASERSGQRAEKGGEVDVDSQPPPATPRSAAWCGRVERGQRNGLRISLPDHPGRPKAR
jgi:hypothetical protein